MAAASCIILTYAQRTYVILPLSRESLKLCQKIV